jgi:hypothetical protein
MYLLAVAGRSLTGTATPVAGVAPGLRAWRAGLAVPFPSLATSSAVALATPSQKGAGGVRGTPRAASHGGGRATDTRGRAGQGEVAEVATPREERGPLYIAVPDLTPQTPLFPAHLAEPCTSSSAYPAIREKRDDGLGSGPVPTACVESGGGPGCASPSAAQLGRRGLRLSPSGVRAPGG